MEKNRKRLITLIVLSSVAFIIAVTMTILILVYFFGGYNPISKKEFYERTEGSLKIPVVEINTRGGEPNDKENYVNCSFAISNSQIEEHNFSVDLKDKFGDEGSVGIRLRGNYTEKAPKKAYRVKFNEKTSVLGLKKAKSWVLLADYYDQSSMRNYTALTIAKCFENLEFTPTPNHVALIMNGEFKGLYLLCEQIDENKGRLNVEDDIFALSGNYPFVVTIDASKKSGLTEGRDYFNIEGYHPVEIKYPDYDERPMDNDVVFDYIQEYMNAVYTTLTTGSTVKTSFCYEPVSFEDLVDVESLVDYYLVNEIMCNYDNARKSIYAYKDTNGKLKFGPVWDFDWSMSTTFDVPYKSSEIESASQLNMAFHSPLFNAFLKNEKYFNMVSARFLEKKDAIINVSKSLLSYKSKIDSVALLDAEQTYVENEIFQYDMEYDYVRIYLLDRCTFLEGYFRSHTRLA